MYTTVSNLKCTVYVSRRKKILVTDPLESQCTPKQILPPKKQTTKQNETYKPTDKKKKIKKKRKKTYTKNPHQIFYLKQIFQKNRQKLTVPMTVKDGTYCSQFRILLFTTERHRPVGTYSFQIYLKNCMVHVFILSYSQIPQEIWKILNNNFLIIRHYLYLTASLA